MFIKMLYTFLSFTLFQMQPEAKPVMQEDENVKTIYTFESPNAQNQWFSINDVVMGGRSKSGLVVTSNQSAVFEGYVSLENNGGFASIRSKDGDFDLGEYKAMTIRVKGDGKKYKLSLRTHSNFDGIIYQFDFPTKKDEWVEIIAPFDRFIPKYRGRVVSSAPKLNSSEIKSFGFLISDKQEGRFRLEIDWFKALKSLPLNEIPPLKGEENHD